MARAMILNRLRKPWQVGKSIDYTDEQKAFINKMTNWGRNQWARTGYSILWLDRQIKARTVLQYTAGIIKFS